MATQSERIERMRSVRDNAREIAVNEAMRAVAATRPGDGSAAEALRRYVGAILSVTTEYAFLLRETPPAERRRDPVLAGTFKALLKRGRANGEFSDAGTPEWWMEVLAGVLLAALEAIDGGMAPEAAGDLAAETLLGGLGRS